jgi:DNA-binding protein YbaB
MKARLPQGYGGGGDMLKQMQKMQSAMAAKQAELDETLYQVSAAGGMVQVSITGKKEITN